MTGNAQWGLMTGANGQIYGVHSLSDQEPIKKKNFRLADKEFKDKTKYSDWVFMASSP
jgi:hypothetical protein